MDKYDTLKAKLDRRFNEIVETNGDEICLFDLCNALYNRLDKYNSTFSVGLNQLKKSLNRRIFFENIKGSELPYIDNFYPVVLANGDYYIDLYLRNSSDRYVGHLRVNSDMELKTFSVIKYKEENIRGFLENRINVFGPYLDCLNTFSNENPGIEYEWNVSKEEKVQKIGDDVLLAYIDLDKINDVCVSLTNIGELSLSESRSKKYGELYDYVVCNSNDLLKTIKVNINDFNSLFQSLYKNSLDEEKVMKLNK